ncbi:MAG: YigZ family protein [Anaerolineae bacterium]
MNKGYRVPTASARAEIEISRSRFIASLGLTESADAARTFIHGIRAEFPDASHHVYAFRAGYPPSVTEGMSDDGEPTGTSGPPVLAVVRGSGAGDLVVVVTRYFGGTKLGTGGLVRAYTEAAQAVLAATSFEIKRDYVTLGIEVPYNLYVLVKRAIDAHGATLLDQSFLDSITLMVRIERGSTADLAAALSELSAGSIVPLEMD